jgi:hypothetical protein
MSFRSTDGKLCALVMAIGLHAVGCGDDGDGDRSGKRTAAIDDLAGGSCEIEVALPPIEGKGHVPVCTPVTYGTRPPSSGSHYGSWPVFRVYDQPVPWGFLVHGLEHGAVVIAYNCPDGCAEDVEKLKALYAAVPPRPRCPRPPVIVTPDPTLDVPFAASAWGATLRARCLDADRITAFIQSRADRGPEFFPDDCGLVDLDSGGWCAAPP